MSICLCGLSADAMLELAAQNGMELEPASPDLSTFSADPVHAAKVLNKYADQLPNPLEILVGDAKQRRRASSLTCRVWNGNMPSGNVYSVGDGLYVTSPELTLLQQANQLHQANLCQMLGRYLGTWTPKASAPNGQAERAPLVTFDSLNEFMHTAGNLRGTNTLRLAMTYTSEGAASAGETSLQLALCLPPQLHGMNLPLATMNYKVDLSARAQKLHPHDSIRIDLCWRQEHFGLEYQGKEHGTQLGADYARWFAAREEDYELWFIANEQLESAAQMGHIGREVARRLSLNADTRIWPTESELQELLDILAGKKHPKPVSYRKLRTMARSPRRLQGEKDNA